MQSSDSSLIQSVENQMSDSILNSARKFRIIVQGPLKNLFVSYAFFSARLLQPSMDMLKVFFLDNDKCSNLTILWNIINVLKSDPQATAPQDTPSSLPFDLDSTTSYLLGLLAKIKCSICSYQLNL